MRQPPFAGVETEWTEKETWKPVGFSTTRWSLIVSSARLEADEQKAHRALAEICHIYWRPVFAFLSTRGVSQEDAQDLTQDFFRMILAPDWLRNVDQRRGRFRSLLLRSLENFVRDAALHRDRKRRGGGHEIISWDDWMSEAPSQVRVARGRLQTLPPEHLFDFRWAITIVEQALRRLGEECERKGRRRLFETLSTYLAAERNANYGQLARRLGLTEHELKRQLHALRMRYRCLLRNEVARTVRDPSDIDDEIRNLCAALAFGADTRGQQ